MSEPEQCPPILSPLQRFMFVPFWHLTNQGWLPEYLGRINLGGDEVRGSRFVIVPFIGEFVWFDKHPCSDPACEAHNDSSDQCTTCGGDGSTNGWHNGHKDEDCPDCNGQGTVSDS